MSHIHPTAIVHPDATLGSGVTIGPYAVVEGPAVIGDGCAIQAHAVITGHVVMGHGNTIGYGAVIGADPQDHAFDPCTESRVILGDENRIREYATIHRGTAPGSATRVGNRCFLMAGSHLGHNVTLADRVIIANNSLLGGHVEVESDVFIGGGSVFHQFVKIGRNAIIQGLSAMSKQVPPFLIGCECNHVAGINVVGLRRSGMSAEERREVKEAFLLLYRSGLNTTQALAAAKERTWGAAGTAFFEFVANAGRRGICSLSERAAG
ncbi:MAG TPA: acyl-ACP--UDP-N-acetylglucosamine O-acyltransferase [Chthoniobacteraceae bacterium]|nr:acyl-ACP--UDP-N-acetylglucosamine O-acyltransferase [Chthoniobacteraceae bacterium]